MSNLKKILLFTILFLFMFSWNSVEAADVYGKIFLQVESHGEAWYVNPEDGQRIYMKDGDTAYSVMRDLGLGITDDDISKIPIGIEERFEELDSDNDGLGDKLEEALGSDPNNPDTDYDGYLDGQEVRNGYSLFDNSSIKLSYDDSLVNSLKGKILLQVESHGEAWYVNTEDSKRHYMTDGEAAYQIMRYLGIGITNDDLSKIPIDSEESLEVQDSDNDGLSDDYEISIGTDPNHPDSDNDNLTDSEEVNVWETNPLLADSDNDGYIDSVELGAGYNPLGEGFIEEGSNIYLLIEDARAMARDARRLSDIKYMQMYLDEYFDDLGVYPETLVFGESLIYGDVVYAQMPEYPEPSAVDVCPADYEYHYTYDDVLNIYEIEVCFESTTKYSEDEYISGYQIFTPDSHYVYMDILNQF
ncbi:hypothetical protein HN800_04670 [bacterium]|jgi:hypothetical protein|nr:hypothetical protein [bacterium]MBT4334929.1 hypothetical protein [bacterium]MBT4495952.1 hypothetical protein [bacterium]MBT4764361.1 hypothetical protein [bacterium]MBT5401732.1 hypothetical protein [bacterium]